MDAIASTLAPTQRAKLQQVADLLLEVYRTLARMRYLDVSWIIAGPHDVDALIPMYQEHNLDPAIMYLYKILPYLHPEMTETLDFYQGSSFADFRTEEHVAQGRDPMYSDEERSKMRPWMTPLSMLGNNQSVILYDSRRHVVGIFDQESCGSRWDHDDDDSDEDSDDDSDDEELGKNDWDNLAGRPAARALKEINEQYFFLTELPGGGENSELQWDGKLTKPLYRKHGWPGPKFDGDAFLVAQARAYAAECAKYDAEEPIREVRKYRGWGEHGGERVLPPLRERVAVTAAGGMVDEEWAARWELFQAEERLERNRRQLKMAEENMERLCPGGVCQKLEELPLWEEKQLRFDVGLSRRNLKTLQDEAAKMKENGGDGEMADRGVQLKIERAKRQLATHTAAHEASRQDVERLCSGRPLFPAPLGLESDGLDYQSRIDSLTSSIEGARMQIDAIQAWVAKLPEGANRARDLALKAIGVAEGTIRDLGEPVRNCQRSLGALKAGQEAA